MIETKTEGQLLSEKLSFEIKNCWETAKPEEFPKIHHFAEQYKAFLNKGKTEREFVRQCIDQLESAGFISLDKALVQGGKFAAGTKIYQNIREKSLLCAVLGEESLREGVNIVGAHVDAPRIDLKTNPLYEDSGFALFDTHYYGGIKYYQWTTIPLALHGVVFTQNGERRDICIGEDESDPVFTITDLLPHLAREQLKKEASHFIDGEDLDALVGSKPYRDEKVDNKVKLEVLRLLYEKYGMVEEDFASAELQLVPADKARDIGFDRSMIGGYGHDDRCCAFTTFSALLQLASGETPPTKTAICFLSDKEEIGSKGNTSADARVFENFIASLCANTIDSYTEMDLRRALSKSSMLSADVNAAFDPNYADLYDKKTSSWCGKGIGLSKYTGSGGKYGGSEANAEFCNKVQALFNQNKIRWQYGDLGKVNKGGGGTIALYMARLGIEVLDCGLAVLSMHSPFEVISKIDLYTAYQAYIVFLRDI
jgi:aspartyl aminopeptidase